MMPMVKVGVMRVQRGGQQRIARRNLACQVIVDRPAKAGAEDGKRDLWNPQHRYLFSRQ